MKVTALTRKRLNSARARRKLLADGYEEIEERGGCLWELYRGSRIGHVITDVRIGPEGRTVFIKTSDDPRHVWGT